MVDTTSNWALRPIEQLDLRTGKVLRTFGSRMDAARWVSRCHPDFLDPEGRYVATVSSTLWYACQNAQNTAYNFGWRLADDAEILARAEAAGTKPVYVYDVRNKFTKQMVFASLEEAAKRMELPVAHIRKHIGDAASPVDGFLFRWTEGKPDRSKKLAPTPFRRKHVPLRVRDGESEMVFKTMKDVAAHIGVSKQAVSALVDTGRPVKGRYLVERIPPT